MVNPNKMNNVTLSICIPTYNRAEKLKDTIQSIVSQKVFQDTNDIEIVISDNCSTDNTMAIVSGFKLIHGEKILYFRNETNIMDKNFELSLQRGNGLFLKLNNDTLLHKENCLQQILDIVEMNKVSKNFIFFLNKGKRNDSLVFSLDHFLEVVSFNCTWIGSFGIWKEDFLKLKDFARYAHLLLTQTDAIFRIIGKNKNIYINDNILFTTQELGRKGGYDLIKVFIENYSFILKESVKNGNLSKKAYLREMDKVLLDFICPWIANLNHYPDKFYFEMQNKFSRIFNFYKFRPFALLCFMVKYIMYNVYFFLKKT